MGREREDRAEEEAAHKELVLHFYQLSAEDIHRLGNLGKFVFHFDSFLL